VDAGPDVGSAKPGTAGLFGEMTRLLNATSSIANKIDPSAASETRFIFSLCIGGRTFVFWSWIAGIGTQRVSFEVD
jgi:hypothetical protein